MTFKYDLPFEKANIWKLAIGELNRYFFKVKSNVFLTLQKDSLQFSLNIQLLYASTALLGSESKIYQQPFWNSYGREGKGLPFS